MMVFAEATANDAIIAICGVLLVALPMLQNWWQKRQIVNESRKDADRVTKNVTEEVQVVAAKAEIAAHTESVKVRKRLFDAEEITAERLDSIEAKVEKLSDSKTDPPRLPGKP